MSSELLDDIPAGSGEDYVGRLWDVLGIAFLAARGAAGTGRLEYQVIVNTPDAPGLKTLVLRVGPGDHWKPVVTIMLPWED